MQSFTSFTLLVSLALASISANASPIDKRQQTEIQCEDTPHYTGNLQMHQGNETYTFSLGGTARYGPHSYPVEVVVSTNDGGDAFTPQNATKFDFFRCKSSYMGDEYLFSSGLLKPAGGKLCVQTSTGSVDTASQYLVADSCSYKEDSTQQQQTFYYDSTLQALKFMSTRNGKDMHAHPTYFSRGGITVDYPLTLNAGDGTKESQFISFV